jgi:hypothetical protein
LNDDVSDGLSPCLPTKNHRKALNRASRWKKRHKSKFCVPSEMLIMRIAKFSGGGSGDE